MPPTNEWLPPLLAITLDHPSRGHLEQTELLLRAGIRWIQLRQKTAPAVERETVARSFVGLCREAGCLSIINDSVALALASGADGVHLGRTDGDWKAARAALGPEKILGGTVNDAEDVARVRRAGGALSYVGVGPWRFTTSKQNLSPVLGAAGIHVLISAVQPLPAWVIGGVVPDDLPAVRATGAAGVAVSGGLVLAPDVQAAADHYRRHWQ